MTTVIPIVFCALMLLCVSQVSSWSQTAIRFGLMPGQTYAAGVVAMGTAWTSTGIPGGTFVLTLSPLICLPFKGDVWNSKLVVRAICGGGALLIIAGRVAQIYPYESMLGISLDVWSAVGWWLAVALLASHDSEKAVLLCVTYAIFALQDALGHDINRFMWLNSSFWCIFALLLGSSWAFMWLRWFVSRLANRWI